ncbi:uncharacterized protein LOC116120920 [Pistacia vera]|uniref:uncharacterized protein LOC116120920 n=1 Tax=Pistacia vera TaxID=55513 RepID=UPI0012634F2F|nr:uncharacterized protein LOC116120920 [Pistacia vera]
MKKKFLGTERAKRVHLQALHAEFEALRMKIGESVSEYISRTMAITNKRQINGEKLEDVTIVEKILRSLIAKFNYVVCVIEESNDIDTLAIDELQSSLLVHEQKIVQQDKEEQALQAATHTKISGPGRGKWKDKKIMLLIQEGNGKAMITTTQMAINRSLQTSQKLNVFDVTEKEEVVSLLMACHANQGTHQNLWYIDTGCSNHMCGDKSAFSDLDETFRNFVTFDDNSKVFVMGKGSVRIHSKEKSDQIISNVFFVPDLKTNLLSVGQLQENGY